MVRVKQRYLLVQILYPPDPKEPQKGDVPDFVALYKPLAPSFNRHVLRTIVESKLRQLYGDIGHAASSYLQGRIISLRSSE
jgi:ribonuclease P/MRP protein subunit POP5